MLRFCFGFLLCVCVLCAKILFRTCSNAPCVRRNACFCSPFNVPSLSQLTPHSLISSLLLSLPLSLTHSFPLSLPLNHSPPTSGKKRYLILRIGCLYYFANETASHPKGCFTLSGYKSVLVVFLLCCIWKVFGEEQDVESLCHCLFLLSTSLPPSLPLPLPPPLI